MHCTTTNVKEHIMPLSANVTLTDKRQGHLSYDDLWERLTFSQQFSAVSLGQFGYFLKFIRRINSSSIAILQLGDKTATISPDGIIKIAANMKLRD